MRWVIKVVFLIMLSMSHAFAANSVVAARVWPAQEYTRIAFEANTQIKYQLLVLKNPDRLVIDMEDMDVNNPLRALSDKILSSDPYIKQVRISQFKPSVVRLVIDLKSEVKPNIFTLSPAGDYRHRLVLDVYPLLDPLMAMLDKREIGSKEAAQGAENSKNGSAATIDPQSPKPVIEPLPTDGVNSGDGDVMPSVSQEEKPANGDQAGNTKPELGKGSDNQGKITIAIDAGHGGEDPGAKGANGSHEKHITLAIAKKLKQKVDADESLRGVLIRDGDYFVPLRGRVEKARKLKADLFISIHADAFTSPAARGSSVFALSEKGATSASARYLAKKENESDLIGGVSLDDKDPVLAKTLLDLSQTATINDSLKLGKAVLGRVGAINQLHKSRVEQAGFAVLKSPDIPSILVETAFISNPDEERKLNDETHQDKLVEAILDGIKKYFATSPAIASRR